MNDFLPSPSHPPPTLYHYCSLQTAMSIICGSKLWLGSLHFMNDYLEMNFLAELVREKHRESSGDSLPAQVHYGPAAFPGPFAICFSENGDLLSQWRAYGDDGAGVALGFNFANLFESSDSERVSLYKVIYDQSETATLAGQIISRVPVDRSGLGFWKAVNRASVVFKNPAFSEECEWRCVCWQYPKGFTSPLGEIQDSWRPIDSILGVSISEACPDRSDFGS